MKTMEAQSEETWNLLVEEIGVLRAKAHQLRREVALDQGRNPDTAVDDLGPDLRLLEAEELLAQVEGKYRELALANRRDIAYRVFGPFKIGGNGPVLAPVNVDQLVEEGKLMAAGTPPEIELEDLLEEEESDNEREEEEEEGDEEEGDEEEGENQ